jgi:hypothetical protein
MQRLRVPGFRIAVASEGERLNTLEGRWYTK